MSTSIDDGAEDSDDSSFSSTVKDPQKELEQFRQQWQSEIKGESSSSNNNVNNSNAINNNDNVPDVTKKISELDLNSGNATDEELATSLFLQGAELERRGKVYDAIRLYRRSIQLVPDIEKRIYEMNKGGKKSSSKKKPDGKVQDENDNSSNLEDEDIENDGEETEDLSEVDLMARFQQFLQKSGHLCKRAGSDKVLITSGGHFCDLPTEIILYIFRWVVSNDLDVRSLDKCSEVCKGFYVCARDSELWKAICIKVWGVNVGILEESQYLSWRHMFYERHRVLYSGCYISKTSYLRFGENSFQDQFYRPIHLIEYHRFIRFFPDGTLMMYTSADDPQQCVSKLRYKSSSLSDSTIHTGHYRLHNDLVIIVLKPRSSTTSTGRPGRRPKNQTQDENMNRTFYIEMKIQNSSKRKFCKLEWENYSIIQIRNKTEITTEFELTPNMYPPFWFSRVKSYHLEANTALN